MSSLQLHSHSIRQIFDWLKNLTDHFIYTELFEILSLFTQDLQLAKAEFQFFSSGFTICSSGVLL